MKKWSAAGTLVRLLVLHPLYYAAALAVAMVVVAKLKDFTFRGAIMAYLLVLAVCVAVHYIIYAAAICRSIKAIARGE